MTYDAQIMKIIPNYSGKNVKVFDYTVISDPGEVCNRPMIFYGPVSQLVNLLDEYCVCMCLNGRQIVCRPLNLCGRGGE